MLKTKAVRTEKNLKALDEIGLQKKELRETMELAKAAQMVARPYEQKLEELKLQETCLRVPYERIDFGDYLRQMRKKLHRKIWLWRYWVNGIVAGGDMIFTRLKWNKCLTKGQLLCLVEAQETSVFERFEIWKPVTKKKKRIVIPASIDPVLVGFIGWDDYWQISNLSCKTDVISMETCNLTYKICEWKDPE